MSISFLGKGFYLLFSYLLGSIPFGYLFAKAKNIDIRSIGSGNIGATNVKRALGWKYAVLTFFFDGLKGFLPPFMAKYLWDSVEFEVISALFAFYGHIFSIFLKFRGGKGVATAFGGILAISPIFSLVLLGIWLVVVGITRISAAGALSAALSAILLSFVWKTPHRSENLMWIIMGATLYFTHRDNIKKLFKTANS